jgi:histidinol-phosphate/aromatic aminotransferase/cobyric acid decarboxylase-like protein
MPGIDEHSHGGNLRALGLESGRDPGSILDFSANLNPLGPPPWLGAAVERGLARVAAYPDPDATAAREAASRRFGLPSSRFLFADGADSLILALPRAVGAARVFAFVPGYSGYLRAVSRSGAAFRPVPLEPERDFALDAAALSAALGEGPAPRDHAASTTGECGAAPGRDLVFIGSPNNPAGGCLPDDALCALATAFPSAVFAVDESFAELSGRPQGLVGRHPSNVLVLRSLTKTYAMPGIRAGFAEGDESLLAAIRRELPAWPLSSFAEEACVEALADRAWGEEGAACVAEARASMVAGIAAMPGLRVVPGPANFILVGLRSGRGARQLRGLLLGKGFAIRVFSPGEGLDDAWFRLAVRRPEENRRLMDAMRDILCGPPGAGKAKAR